LWNKRLPVGTGYTSYSTLNSSTIDGTFAAVGSVSLACLSCHDGTQAMDIVLNVPGPGGQDLAGTRTGSAGPMRGTPIPMLGADLRADHPVSIAYAGGACSGVKADCTPGADGRGDADFRPVQYDVINGADQWWVDTSVGIPNLREKSDMVLYTRDFDGTTGPSVECASCHDPHDDRRRPVSFLRLSNTHSDVCLACHVK
jgi:hypothetical protein